MMEKLLGFLGLEEDEEFENDDVDKSEEEFIAKKKQKRNNNIVSLHSQKSLKVVLSEPRSYDEAQEIADHLRSHRPVVVNLQRLQPDQARRVVDFLSGCVYALSGQIKKIGSRIFICTPENIDVHGAITEILKEEQEEEVN